MQAFTQNYNRSARVLRRAAWGLALLGLLGCAVFQPGGAGQPAAAPVLPAAQLASSPTFTFTPTVAPTTAVPPSPSPLPSPTFIPSLTVSLPPTLTPFPSLTPQPTFDISHLTPSATATNVASLYGHCCTLRVRNGGSIPLWIGKKLPKNGSIIKPRWYIEFYLAQPTTMTVYWCLWVDRTKVPDPDLLGAPGRGSDNLFDCRQRDVPVTDGLTEIYVQ